MIITKIRPISFSPTGNSKKVINAIASSFEKIPVENIDITSTDTVVDQLFQADELVVFGAPVYAGRVAPLAVERLKHMHGNTTPAVIVVTYGNREYEDALLELQDLIKEAGFVSIAAASFIGEHSFSTMETPIAQGRPDAEDLAAAKAFGRDISKKLATAGNQKDLLCRQVPGNRPYKEGTAPNPFAPTLLETKCSQCGFCLPACPTGAISMAENIAVNHDLCILCCACIKICPEEALIMDAPPLVEKQQSLFHNCSTRKEPELYI